MVTRYPDIAFTRNPIYFKHPANGRGAYRYHVLVGGNEVYAGYCSIPTTIDVSEIAEAYVAPIPSPEGTPVGDSGILLQLEGADEFEGRLVRVCHDYGQSLRPDFFALPGGVSPQNFRRLKELDSDIFEARLLDKRRNFFLTTRTHGWRIVMDEFEVFPLVFVNLFDEDAQIMIQASGTEYELPTGDIVRGIYAIDINAARMKFAAEFGLIASVFDVYYDGYHACQIVLRDTAPERDTTLVKFRNSLGVFELLHLSGQKEAAVAPVDSEDTGKRYDSVSGRYVDISRRKTLKRSIEVSTGFRTDDEIRFILDMAASDEAYLQTASGWTPVTPSVENLRIQSPQLKPESLKVTFTMADEYDNHTPDIKDLGDFERPRIFSDQHTHHFN